MVHGYSAQIVRAAKVRHRLLPITAIDGRTFDSLRVDWVAIVCLEWEFDVAGTIATTFLLEFRGRLGELLDYVDCYTLDLALSQAQAIVDLRPDAWMECEFDLDMDVSYRLAWRTLLSLVRA